MFSVGFISSLAYLNLFGIKDFFVVVLVVVEDHRKTLVLPFLQGQVKLEQFCKVRGSPGAK
jgi:hypothetical protein